MLQTGDRAPSFTLDRLNGSPCELSWSEGGRPKLLVFFETDCPACALTLPYLGRLDRVLGGGSVIGISQDGEQPTAELVRNLRIPFPVLLDRDLEVSRTFDPEAVPALFLLDDSGEVILSGMGFDKATLNALADRLSRADDGRRFTLAEPYDGAPDRKPGCGSRHREGLDAESSAPESPGITSFYADRGVRASRLTVPDGADLHEYCMEAFGDALPVVPPTVERVERMLAGTPLAAEDLVARVPPNYGAATVEKIAANAVMAGCTPAMMPIVIAAVRAACDERFNLHGVQATTHFAAPLVVVNGPIRKRLGFASGSNVFSNVARANSALGRALQLVCANLGGARPGEIDMSTLGNPGKFSSCIAENEEESPWEPLHVELGFGGGESTVTLFAAEPPRGVSEHNARDGDQVLTAISRALATVWSYRMCGLNEAVVVLCPEHARTLHRDGFGKREARDFLFDNTGIPISAYRGVGEGCQFTPMYSEVTIDGEPCYRKFGSPDAIRIVVAGGTAGKFSAVIGSWATGTRGSRMVTYPV